MCGLFRREHQSTVLMGDFNVKHFGKDGQEFFGILGLKGACELSFVE